LAAIEEAHRSQLFGELGVLIAILPADAAAGLVRRLLVGAAPRHWPGAQLT
jgi:hypothetical protein